jgi:pyruvate ferredoxin oxidoreductase gamma subunit
MLRIRFHGRGGQGVRTASQVLGTAFFFEGYEVQDAPRYGAERRGAPLFAYVRAAREPIMERGVISRPDLVLVADETLVPVPAAGVLQGIAERTVLLLCSAVSPETWRDRLKLSGPVLTLPLTAEAIERGDRAQIGSSCAGAAARLTGVIRRESLERALREELAKLGPAVVAANLERALAAFDAMAPHAGTVTAGAGIDAGSYRAPEWIELPLELADVAAPDIHAALTSERANTGTWRTHTPVIDYERCSRCSWICGTFCPDSAIRVDADHSPRIDLDHCKGCMVCVAVCPPHAIRAVAQREAGAVAARSSLAPRGGDRVGVRGAQEVAE